ncbi:MAG: sel1 repeat family protein [Gammaproteobacteria bacterium]|nr:sel1 repeat family protein [Gammaproteobacteria bacterium]
MILFVIRHLSLSGILFGLSMTIHATEYNDGFIAAEAGDYKTAFAQWGPLAKEGHAIAQFNLALLYHSGSGIELDESKALSWYMRSAHNGYHKAQEYLSVGYREGWFGLPRDAKQAEFWQKRLDTNIHLK